MLILHGSHRASITSLFQTATFSYLFGASCPAWPAEGQPPLSGGEAHCVATDVVALALSPLELGLLKLKTGVLHHPPHRRLGVRNHVFVADYHMLMVEEVFEGSFCEMLLFQYVENFHDFLLAHFVGFRSDTI